MQVLKTTSPETPEPSRDAPKRTPSKTAPVSSARRPGTVGTISSAVTERLHEAGDGGVRDAEVGHAPIDEGQQDTPAQPHPEQRGVGRERAEGVRSHLPLGGGIEER